MEAEPRKVRQIRLADHGRILVTRDQGRPILSYILQCLEEEDLEVVLDGVEAYTPSFLDEILGKCLMEVGKERFRKSVSLISESAEHRRLANLVLSNRASRPASVSRDEL